MLMAAEVWTGQIRSIYTALASGYQKYMKHGQLQHNSLPPETKMSCTFKISFGVHQC